MKPHERMLTVLLILSLATTTAYARDRDDNPPGPKGGVGTNWENPPGPAGGPGASPDQRRLLHFHLLKAFDADNDGALSVSERQAMHRAAEGNRRDVISTFDTDGDGELSRPERDALFESAKVHFLERFDGDGDGRLTGAEREAAEAARVDATRERAKSGDDGNTGRTPDARDRGTGGNDGNTGKPEQPSPRKSDGGGKGGSHGGSKGENSRGTPAGRR